MVTADHGMNAEKHHGGMEMIMRDVPFYCFGDAETPDSFPDVAQLGIAATIFSRIGVQPNEGMRPALFR